MADFTALKTAIQNAIKQNGNEEITGNLLQEVLLAIVTTLGDGSINDLVTALGSEATTRGNADTTLQGGINTVSAAITAINNAIGNGCVYAGIATPSSTPASGKVFYLALTAGTYTNYGGLEVSQGINILKNNGSTWSLDSFLGIDDAPTPSSNNLVKSGGVFNDIMTNGSAFDLTAYNNGTTYADLNAALTALNALPAAHKKGGMSMKYVQSSDNKYVQYRLMSDSFNTIHTNWQGVDDEPTAGSENLVKSGGVEEYATKFHYYLNHNADFPFDIFINADGTNAPNQSFCATDFIYIKGLQIKTFNVRALMANQYGGGICFYDENKVFISSIYNVVTPPSISGNKEYELNVSEIPVTAAYVRVSAYKSELDAQYPFVRIDYTNSSIKNEIDSTLDEVKILKGKEGKTYSSLSQEDFVSGIFINSNGGEDVNQNFCATEYLLVKPISSLRCKANFSNQYGGGIAFYDIDEKFISSIYNIEAGGITDNQEYELLLTSIPSNAYYFRICAYKASNESNKAWANITYLDSVLYSFVSKGTINLNEKFENNLNKIHIFLSRIDFVIDGEFVNADGTIGYTAGFNTTDYLPIRGIVSLKVNAVMENKYGGGIAFYDKDLNFISSIYNISGGSLAPSTFNEYELNLSDIPADAYFIKVQGSQNPSSEPYVNLVLTTSKVYSDIYQYEKEPKIIKEYLANSATSLTSLEVADTPQTKNLYNIGVSMLVDTMGEIQITKGVTQYRCGKVSITDTNVIVYDPNAPSTILQTIPHGLTIADLLIVNINVSDTPTKVSANTYFATLQICTNDTQTFETEIAWTGCSGNAKVEKLSGEYSNVKIYFGGDAFKKDIWLFGDSYTDTWCKYAIAFGAKNYMIDGKSGRASTEALTSLRNALKLGLPKVVIWMMGMNNGDTSSAVNATWLADFNTLKSIANEYGFSVIPCTIPNTPTVTNYYKNQVIKSSGLDYIDIADILGANEIGSSWFTGLISGDNVHPSDKGAQVIAEYLISCVPKMKL